MKIAISCLEDNMGSVVDSRFGRCPYFAIVEVDKDNKEIKSSEVIKNEASGQRGGAGITASEFIGNKEVDVVITTNLGPKAYSVLNQLGIDTYRGSGKIKEVINQFLDGELEKIEQATGPTFMGKP